MGTDEYRVFQNNMACLLGTEEYLKLPMAYPFEKVNFATKMSANLIYPTDFAPLRI